MANVGDIINLTPSERLTFTTTTAASNGELLTMEVRYGPAGRPPPEHYHPAQQEEFTGVRGTVTARINGAELTISAGETVTIPPGANHAFWNPCSEEAVLKWEIRPALRTEQMFEDLAKAGSMLRAALVVPRYKQEFRLSSGPQRAVLDALAPLAGIVNRRR